MPSVLQREVHSVPVDSLVLFPGNARRGDLAVIKGSLLENQQYKPVVVQATTRVVLAGNNTLVAARESGWSVIDAVFVDVDDDRARKINAVDNRSSDLATYDDQLLLDLLEGLSDLGGTGYDLGDLDDLRAVLEEHVPAPTDDRPQSGADHGELADPARHAGSGESVPGDYTGANVRALVLAYPGERYVWVVNQLAALIERGRADNNADVVVSLLQDATGETAPHA